MNKTLGYQQQKSGQPQGLPYINAVITFLTGIMIDLKQDEINHNQKY